MKSLTNHQKAEISRVARIGWNRAKELELTTEKEADWRGREAVEATTVTLENETLPGRRVSAAYDDDYETLMAHFHNLAGNGAEALKWALQASTAKKRRALFALDVALKSAKLSRVYASTLCRDFWNCTLDQATPDQLQKVIITVRTRARQHKKAAQEQQPA